MNKNKTSNKTFDWFFSAIFFCSFLFFYHENSGLVAISLLLLAVLFSIITAFIPSALSILNGVWFNLGLCLGRIVDPIILSVLFFLLIVPVAVLTRLFGRDMLLLNNYQPTTYWVDKEAINPDSFKDQF